MRNLKSKVSVCGLALVLSASVLAETTGDRVWKEMQESMKQSNLSESDRSFLTLMNEERARKDAAKASSAKRGFYSEFVKAQDHIIAGKLAAADKPMAKLHKMENLTAYEVPRLWLLDYWYAGKKGDKPKENEALTQVVATGANQIDSDVFVDAGVRLFTRQYNAKDYGRALDTVGFLRQDRNALGSLDSISSEVGKLEELAAGTQDFSVTVKADDAGIWSTKLLRPAFYLDKIEGTVSSLDFDCEKKKTSLPYSIDSVMAIPASWGSCSVKINASPSATFGFVQSTNKPA